MRVGVIGTRWGLMHVGAFRAAGAEVVALCGLERDRTRAIAQAEHIALATDDVELLIDAVDIVVVASPDAVHHAHVTRALSAGRAVLCEKPLAPTQAEADALVVLARGARPTAVVFPYRAVPSFMTVRGWLAGRRARIVVTIQSAFTWTDAWGDLGGTSHVLDAVRWLAGSEPTSVQATLRADVSAMHITFANDTLAIVTWLLAPEPGLHGSWSIITDDAEVGFSAGYVPAAGGWCIGPVRAFETGHWRDLHAPLVPVDGQPEPWAAAHRSIARDFLALVRGDGDARTLASFADGARVQTILQAARSGRPPDALSAVRW